MAAAATALERDKTPDLAEQEAIARAFARGRVAAEAARAPAERSAAVDAYREVVAMHPTLARAHVELASALFDESSPQSSGYLSVATIEAVEAALAELEAARDLGWDDLETRGNLGFYQMLVGLARPTTDLTDDAVANNASALELGPELPVLRYNLAAALLADGQADAARSAYAEAIAATVAREADGEPRFTDAERAGVVAGAITDLELIAAARPDDPGMTAAAAEITSAIVAGTGDPIPADRAGAPVTVSGLELLADPASLWWQADIEGLDPERDSVSVLWLVEDPAVPGWHVLPNHSGPLRLGGWTTAGEFHVDGAAPAYWASQSHLLASDPRRCVPDGRYRLELFVNGRRAAGPLVETLDMPELVSETRPDLGVLFCRPADWERGTDLRGDSIRFTRADRHARDGRDPRPSSEPAGRRRCGRGHRRARRGRGDLARNADAGAGHRAGRCLPDGPRGCGGHVVRGRGRDPQGLRRSDRPGDGARGRAGGHGRVGRQRRSLRHRGLVRPAVSHRRDMERHQARSRRVVSNTTV